MENIIHGLSNEDYHNGEGYRDYISSTSLKHYLKSPRYFKFMQDNPQPQTEAMRFGSLFHDLMAYASQFPNGLRAYDRWSENIAVFEPPENEKTGKPYGATSNIYMNAYTKFLQDNEGKTIASAEEVKLIGNMFVSLIYNCGSTSAQVNKLLKWGKPEVSIFYETEDGIKIKIRPDLLTSNKIVDWKSFAGDDLTEESINRVILKYGYHISAAQYQWVYNKVTGKWVTFYLVFIQKQPPYDCVMVDMSNYGYRYIKEWDMVQTGPGAVEFQRLLDLHTRCFKANEWPGAETFIPGDKYRIMEIEPPRYYANKFMDEI